MSLVPLCLSRPSSADGHVRALVCKSNFESFPPLVEVFFRDKDVQFVRISRRLADLLAELEAFSCPPLAILLLLVADHEPPFAGHFLPVQGLDGINTPDDAGVSAAPDLRETGNCPTSPLKMGFFFDGLRYRPGPEFFLLGVS